MPVHTLFELARQRLIKNIDMLNDVGDLPYSFLEPVLRYLQNPDQLQELEENCAQLLGETGDIWLKFIKRDVPDWEKRPHEPRDPRNWSKVYRKLVKDTEREKQADADALKQQMQALQKNRAQNTTTIMNTRVAYGPTGRFFASRGSGGGSSWGPQSGAPTKTGKIALDKLRRGMFDRNRERPKVTVPPHVLAQRKTQVKAVPARLVRMAEHEIQEAPRTMVLSKPASASMANKPVSRPSASKAHITNKPAPQQKAPLPTRTSLPAGQQFHAPKLRTSTQDTTASTSDTAQKRKREAHSMFQPKKRKL